MNLIDFDHNFYGRREVLDTLRKRVLSLKDGYRQNVAILGPRFSGKTALIQQFINDVEDKDVVIIYLDLEGRDFTYFCAQFTKGLLYQYLKKKIYRCRKI